MCSKRRAQAFAIILILTAIAVGTWGQPARDGALGRREFDLVAIPERPGWLAAVAAPVAARLRGASGRPALLIAVGSNDGATEAAFVRRLGSVSCLELFPGGETRPLASVRVETSARAPLSDDASEAALTLIDPVWGRPPSVVVALEEEPAAMLIGAALAARTGRPLVPIGVNAAILRVLASLRRMGVGHVSFCSDRDGLREAIRADAGLEVDWMTQKEAAAAFVALVGREKVRNVILVREPDLPGDTEGSAWIAPWLGFLRDAPLVVVRSADAAAATEAVAAAVREWGIRPRTVTIVGDLTAIGVQPFRDPQLLGEYEVEVEPCSLPAPGWAVSVGTGRIPFAELWRACLLIARGELRHRRNARQGPSPVLLIANPNRQFGDLPLCETVSRLTAMEMRNLGVKVHDFYGEQSLVPEVAAAAEDAGLIVFEGHVTDQNLFPSGEGDVVEDGWANEVVGEGDSQPAGDGDVFPLLALPDVPDRNDGAWVADAPPVVEAPWEADAVTTAGAMEVPDGPPPGEDDMASGAIPSFGGSELRGMPLVILQSCHSLEEPVATRVFDLGGVGLVGSVTNIHSASGASFIKNYCDSLVWRNATAGEALRDARNYFLALADLKDARGHKEQAKARRVAYSFRLWGDPEVMLGMPDPPNPKKPAPRVDWVDATTVRVTMPSQRLSEARTEKYAARVFPRSQTAGIVKRVKTDTARRLMPLYFFRLPVPEGVDLSSRVARVEEGDGTKRAVLLPDPYARHAWLLYFPAKAKKNEEVVIRFTP